MHKLSNFKLDRSIVQEFPTVQLNDNRASSFSNLPSRTMTLQDAVKLPFSVALIFHNLLQL